MHTTYTPDAQLFICVALRWAVFELHPFYGKVHWKIPKGPWHVQGKKFQYAYYMCTTYTPRRKFSFIFFSPRWAVFELWAKFVKSAPNALIICSRLNVAVCIYNIPLSPQISIRITLRWAVFGLRRFFLFLFLFFFFFEKRKDPRCLVCQFLFTSYQFDSKKSVVA